MDFKDANVYIASPFFNEKQIKIVEGIENLLDEYGVKYFSPRSEGVLSKMTPEEKNKYMDKIYNSNIFHMENSNILLAVIDDRDIGTIFELGYYTKAKNINTKNRYIFTFTDENFGLNIMIQKSVDAHFVGNSNLELFLKTAKYNLEINDNQTSLFRNFNPEIF